MKKPLTLAGIAFAIFAIFKWGGLIVGVLGTIAAIVLSIFFVGGGDE